MRTILFFAIMWDGGGLTGVTYETTPDGREGWLNYFIKQGWDVYSTKWSKLLLIL